MASWDGYADCFNDFTERSGHDSSLVTYLTAHSQRLGLDEARTMLSVGPGSGTIDQPVVVHCLPNLQRYIALEPDPDMTTAVKAKMTSVNVKQDYIAETLEEYAGPPVPVDVILISHVAYYFADTLEDQLRRALSWLTEEGKLLLVHDQNSIHKLVVKALDDKWGPSSLVTVEDIRGRIASMNINSREEEIEYRLDVSHPGKGYYEFISILTNRKTSRDEVDKVLQLMEEQFIPNTKSLRSCQSMFVISK